MKKILLLTLSLIFTQIVLSQTVDTIIDKGIYKSYFCKKYKEPLYVSYQLYKGGGDCDRSSFNFKNDTKIKTSTRSDYKASGYDMGHLANSEDFANDCIKDELTFRFYNCLPQTPNLNRGIWKQWETEIRDLSQRDSLYVICGGIFSSKSKVIGKGVYVPDYCWKIVISMTTKKVLYVLLFTNNNNAIETKTTIDKLEKMGNYKIVLPI